MGENGQRGRREERIRRLKHEKIGGKYKLKKKNIYGYVCRNELVYRYFYGGLIAFLSKIDLTRQKKQLAPFFTTQQQKHKL